MNNAQKNLQSLANHTFQLAQAVRDFGKIIPMTVSNVEDLRQLVRVSGLAGEFLVKAQEAPNEVEYRTRIKYCIEELRSTHYWLGLIDAQGSMELETRRKQLMKAAEDLSSVFRKVL